MASHDSWIDADELASLAGEFAPPPPLASFEDDLVEPPSPECYSLLLPPAIEPEPTLLVQPDPEVVIIAQHKSSARPAAPATIPEEEDSAGASPQVIALWSRKLSEIKQRARSNGLLISKGSPPAPTAQNPRAFRAPIGSTTEKLRALSQWLSSTVSDCEFFACDDWGNELLPGSNAIPELAAAALTLSHASCLAAQKAGADIPAFLCTDLGAGMLTVFPSALSAGRRFLAAVSESPLDLDSARRVSTAFRSII